MSAASARLAPNSERETIAMTIGFIGGFRFPLTRRFLQTYRVQGAKCCVYRATIGNKPPMGCPMGNLRQSVLAIWPFHLSTPRKIGSDAS